jgi:hypothetical protein
MPSRRLETTAQGSERRGFSGLPTRRREARGLLDAPGGLSPVRVGRRTRLGKWASAGGSARIVAIVNRTHEGNYMLGAVHGGERAEDRAIEEDAKKGVVRARKPVQANINAAPGTAAGEGGPF